MPGIMHLDEVCGLVLLSQHAAAETHNKHWQRKSLEDDQDS